MLSRLIVIFGMLLISSGSYPQSLECNYSNSISGITNEACVYNQMYSYSQTDTLAKKLIAKICDLVYLKPHFAVEPCNNIKTCRAFIYDDRRRYIFFDREFIEKIIRNDGNEWSLIGILAHEIAHHLDGHTMRGADIDEHRKDEMEADEFSGAILARMGATEEQAFAPLLNVTHPSCELEKDDAYPCFESRKAAILRGYSTVNKREVKKGFILNRNLKQIDISSFGVSPVRNEGSDATCVGFTIAYGLEYEILRKFGDTVLISARYIYNRAGGVQYSGLYFQRALDTVRSVGAIEEKYWPYRPDDYDSSKLKQADSVKNRYFIKAYKQVPINAEDIISVLQEGHVVLASIKVFSYFDMSKSIWIINDTLPDTNYGLKSICLLGYDPKTKLFKFKNTWGMEWGDKGYGYFSENDLQKLITEAYRIEL